MTPATCIRANADASPACTEQCRGCSFMQTTLEMLPLKKEEDRYMDGYNDGYEAGASAEEACRE